MSISLARISRLLCHKARIAGALGGRVAEQLVFGASQVTTGAGGDLQQVERMARAMVTQFGMSDPRIFNDWRLVGMDGKRCFFFKDGAWFFEPENYRVFLIKIT